MESDSRDSVAIRLERYAQWEKASPITCFVLGATAAVSAVAYHPSALAVAGNLLGGITVFFSWRAALREREGLSVALGILGVALALSEPVFDAAASIQHQMAKGLPWFGLGLFLCVYAYRLRRRHSA